MKTFYEWQKAPKGEFAVIGDPISHSWSPQIHHAAYHALHLPYRYHAIRVPLSEFNEALLYLQMLGYIGVNVTSPLKEAAFQWAVEIELDAIQYKALNTLHLHQKKGTNTDAPGFMKTLECLSVPAGSNVLILGAGGSAKTLAKVLAREGFGIFIFNRTYEHAKQMVHELEISAVILTQPSLKDMQLVIHACSSQNTLSLSWENAPESCIAYDLQYQSNPTSFLLDAAHAGQKIYDGKALLVEQAALSFEWWLQLPAPRKIMSDAILHP